METATTKQQDKIESMAVAKDKAFNMVRHLKVDLHIVKEDIALHNTTILKNKSTIATLREHVDAIRQDHSHILRRLKNHDLKLNASGSLGSSPWALQLDTEK